MTSHDKAFDNDEFATPGTGGGLADEYFMLVVAGVGALTLTQMDQPGGSKPATLKKVLRVPELGRNLLYQRDELLRYL